MTYQPQTVFERMQEDIPRIAGVPLNEGAPLSAVWYEALTLYRVRFETKVLPPQSD